MLKRMATAGLLGLAVGGSLLTAAPALAADDPQNSQIIGAQTCRAVGATVLGATLHNVLGITDESGDCVNGSQYSR